MSWKDRLTRPRWEHKDPTVRAKAIAELDDPRMARALPGIIEHDADAGVRLQALRRLDDEGLWLRRAEQDEDSDIRAAADERILRYLRRPAADRDALDARLSWTGRQTDTRRLQDLAGHAADPEVRRAALEGVSAQGFLGDRVIAEPDESLAMRALERIDQASTLRRIAGELRKTNKQRYQRVTARLDDLDPETGDTTHASAEAIVRAAETLARGEWTGDRGARRDELREKWNTLGEHVSEAQRRRFEGAMDIVERAGRGAPAKRSRYDDASTRLHRLLEADNAASARAELDRLLAGLDDDARAGLAALIEQVETHVAALDATPHDALKELAGTVTGLRDAGQTPPADRIDRLTSRWDQAWNRLDHPTQADVELKNEVMGALAVLRDRIESAAAAPAKPAPAANGEDPAPVLDEAAAALDNGELAQARDRLNRARKALGGRRDRNASRLAQLDGRLKEMRDWQHWSNNRIRKQLIDEVGTLPGAGHHPDALIAKLKEARRQWQALEDAEHLPGDKRPHAAPPGLWRQFQAACKTAHDSAQPFFEKRHEIQAKHKSEVDALIAEAKATGEDTDTAAVRKLLNRARKAIRRLDEIPPADRSGTAKRLRSVMDQLGGHLEARNAEIEKAKLKLVNEARQLLHESDRGNAIERAKALQKQWQATGSLPRGKEQKLWKEFRAPIDPLFERDQADRAEEAARRQEQDEQARALVDELAAVLERPDAELDDQAGPVSGLESRWQELGTGNRRLRDAFQAKLDEFNRRRETARRSRRRDRWQALADAAELLQAVHAARTADRLDDPARADFRDRWQALAGMIGDALPDRLDTVMDGEAAEADEDDVRDRLVALEFLAGLPSPDEDRQRRMDYQVRRLSNRLGGDGEQPDPEREFERLLVGWVASLPHAEATRTVAKPRFDTAVKELQKELLK